MKEVKKSFDIATILTVITRTKLTSDKNIENILTFLLGRIPTIDELSKTIEQGRVHILRLYPELNNINITSNNIKSKDGIYNVVHEYKSVYGEYLDITPINNIEISTEFNL